MNRKKRIKEILEKKLINFSISIIDNSHLHKGHNNFSGKDETHLLVTLKKDKSTIFNRIKIHRLINDLLKDEFKEGLHSLQIKII